MTTFQTSFSLQLQNCLHEFIADLDLEPDELLILRSTSLNDLQKVLRQIQECQKASRSMLYMKRLSPFLEAIVQYCEVLEIFLAPKECISCIWVRRLSRYIVHVTLSYSRGVLRYSAR